MRRELIAMNHARISLLESLREWLVINIDATNRVKYEAYEIETRSMKDASETNIRLLILLKDAREVYVSDLTDAPLCTYERIT